MTVMLPISMVLPWYLFCFVIFSLPFIWFGCLVLWCLTPLSTIFQLYRGSQFYWWRKPQKPRENHQPTTSHWQTLSLNVVHLALSGIRTHNINGDRHRLNKVVINPTTKRWRPRRSLFHLLISSLLKMFY
jgi:hypothetical protein